MAENSLESNFKTDSIVQASHVLQLIEALNGVIIGRLNNVPTAGQDLGTDDKPFGDIKASGQLKAGSANVSGALEAGSVDISGALEAASADVSGALDVGSIDSSGAIEGASANISGEIDAGSIDATGTIEGASVTATGTITAPTLSASTGITLKTNTINDISKSIPETGSVDTKLPTEKAVKDAIDNISSGDLPRVYFAYQFEQSDSGGSSGSLYVPPSLNQTAQAAGHTTDPLISYSNAKWTMNTNRKGIITLDMSMRENNTANSGGYYVEVKNSSGSRLQLYYIFAQGSGERHTGSITFLLNGGDYVELRRSFANRAMTEVCLNVTVREVLTV